MKELLKTYLKDSPQWLKELIKNPISISQLIEPHSPRLAKGFVSYASEVLEPQVVGMGVRVSSLSDDGVALLLPYRWKNSTSFTGEIQRGALVSAAEYGLKLFWQRHLLVSTESFFISNIQVEVTQALAEDLSLRVESSPQERQDTLFKLQSQGEISTSSEVLVFNSRQQRVAQVNFEFTIRSYKSLPTGKGSMNEHI